MEHAAITFRLGKLQEATTRQTVEVAPRVYTDAAFEMVPLNAYVMLPLARIAHIISITSGMDEYSGNEIGSLIKEVDGNEHTVVPLVRDIYQVWGEILRGRGVV